MNMHFADFNLLFLLFFLSTLLSILTKAHEITFANSIIFNKENEDIKEFELNHNR